MAHTCTRGGLVWIFVLIFGIANFVQIQAAPTTSVSVPSNVPGNHSVTGGISKRGFCWIPKSKCCNSCCPSKVQSKRPYDCNGEIPPLGEMRAVIQDDKVTQKHTSLFYTGYPHWTAYTRGKEWLLKHGKTEGIKKLGLAHFNNMVHLAYFQDLNNAIGTKYGLKGQQRFQKLLSQAFAEESEGIVYVFMPKGLETFKPANPRGNIGSTRH
ncbi:hypothetical protein K461DRAFT_311755 [Myriangium duriaei CBS 260.36]|uniref:Uncharacterized protein n=1 Tax=Myriangium duriaei CBS 260.36 TaxID=1168546 RepID=A0A9P4J1C3_9PEZI|nr:hypothetical protein K461DRAFT_311755 [Myriangium duriaei CBS 260.36]